MPFVAVVDDEESVRKALKRLLRAAGLEAESYATGQEFLEQAATREPDCVVLDLHMPVMSGSQVLAQIRKMPRRPPVVVITAHGARGCGHAGGRVALHAHPARPQPAARAQDEREEQRGRQ